MKFHVENAYSAINADEVKVGSLGFFADNLESLVREVCNENATPTRLVGLNPRCASTRFMSSTDSSWVLFYLVEAPKETLCTRRELANWLAHGNGEYILTNTAVPSANYCYAATCGDKPVQDNCRVRRWEDEDWHVPTKEYMNEVY